MDLYERIIVNLLAEGYKQPQIEQYFIDKNISGHGLRTIEIKIRKIKKDYGAKTIFQLAVILTKNGIIK